MKLNDAQLKYVHEVWRIPINRMRDLDAYRGWLNIGYCDTCSEYIDSVILFDDNGHAQYSLMTDGRLPDEDSLPDIPDEDEYSAYRYD